MYKLTDIDLGEKIINTIYEKTGITATCGIGPNMLLSKVSMDIEAKHNRNNIAKWDYNDVETKLWNITPLSKMWGIGSRMEARLNNMGIFKIGDIAKCDINILKNKFGIIGEELWNHANGIDLSIINESTNQNKFESFSHSKMLFKDYNEENVKIVISDLIDNLVLRLNKENKLTNLVSLSIKYSNEYSSGFHHSIKLDTATDSKENILKYCLLIFDKFYDYIPIRKVGITFGMLEKKKNIQLNIFEKIEKIEKSNKMNLTIINIKETFGKNSLLKASNLLKDSITIDDNCKIGGHYK